ncbi:MAG: DinB family protein [Tunicatimonas sp.]
MKRNKNEVAQQVFHEIAEANHQVQHLQQQPINALRHRPRPDAWSALDCVEHMNLFYDDYLPRMAAAVQRATSSSKLTYSPGFFGQKMIDSLRPQQGKRRMKIKTFKKMTPNTDNKPPEPVFAAFLQHHAHLEELLTQAASLNWNRVKVASAIGPVLRFKLGDCFRLLLAHTERHLLQAQEAMEDRKANG